MALSTYGLTSRSSSSSILFPRLPSKSRFDSILYTLTRNIKVTSDLENTGAHPFKFTATAMAVSSSRYLPAPKPCIEPRISETSSLGLWANNSLEVTKPNEKSPLTCHQQTFCTPPKIQNRFRCQILPTNPQMAPASRSKKLAEPRTFLFQ